MPNSLSVIATRNVITKKYRYAFNVFIGLWTNRTIKERRHTILLFLFLGKEN